METASTEVTSIRHRNNVKKSTWRTYRYFVDFESRIPVEMSKLNWCLSWLAFQNRCNFDELSTWNFHVESMANRQGCVHWEIIFINYAKKKTKVHWACQSYFISMILFYFYILTFFINWSIFSKIVCTKNVLLQTSSSPWLKSSKMSKYWNL